MPKSNFSYVSKVIGSGKKFRSLSSSAKFFHGKSRQDEDESRKCQTECSKTTMYRRPHFAKYLQNTPRPLQSDLSMDKCASNKRPTTLQKRAMTSNDLLRGGRVPIGRGSNKDLVPSPGSLSSEGLKRSFFLLMRSMEKDDQLDDNTDARMLFNAIRKGKIRLAKFILDAAPVDLVNCSDFKGKTPLIIACSLKEELSRDLMVDLLLNYDADVNLCDDDGRTPLSHACEKRCNDIIDILVKQANVDPDIPDSQGNTALIYCSMVGNDVGIDILTRHFRRLGLNVDHVNSEGLTALLLASKQGNITCAKLLIEQGHASLLRRDKKEGFTAQEWLLYNGFTWDDIAPLTTRVKSRARFVRAINVARIASFQSARKVSEDALRIPIGMKCAHKKATFPEGKGQRMTSRHH
ncbi:hypothetical protein FSP39_006054 [Pinctada imbricata]|uniref:Uncharacterized protein n=1 Tax=Pinctada imbricata TaxID=66713 RepID=A0AA89BYU7_PINIB|nr:hypothetical protein FSP39_006054 [Pinctada imbricata]